MRHSAWLVLGLVAVLGTACGTDHSGHAASGGGSATKTVQIEMRDLAYEPKAVSVDKGSTVRFVFTNKGKVAHDAFIGDEAAQMDHEQEMRDGSQGGMAGMDHGGVDDGITVEPGKTAELTHTFSEAGTMLIGCHEPGHYAAGMKLTVTVA